jgi:hypothetical protein
LSFSDHHLEEKDIIAGVTTEGRFILSKKGSKTYTFFKNDKKLLKQHQSQMTTGNRQKK